MTIATRGQGIPGDTSESNQSINPISGPAEVPCDSQLGEESGGVGVGQSSGGGSGVAANGAEPDFPLEKLASLEEKISNLRWVVPVLPDQELECLLRAAIELSRAGVDTRSEACQRFFREGLTVSFTKILTDDAVSSWKPNIQMCINQNCVKLVELCVLKLPHDWFPLLDLLAMVLNPNNKFHTFNASRQSESAHAACNLSEEELYARPASDIRNARGWLVDLINRFGELGGFQVLQERFQSGKSLSVAIVHALLRPFGLAYEYLTPHTINKFLLPILEMVPGILDKLTDDELKREAKTESKSDIVSAIIKSSKNLASRVANQEELIRTLEGFRLKMILRQLQISSFNGKMNALNEINKVISSVSYYPNRHQGIEEEEYLTPERMAKWLNENRVLEIVLRDSLHQPQYVEKLEKILRFVIKEHALSLSDLDAVWAAQVGKHEAIVKNVHDLLAKLAWDFSPEQLDHLFECFQSSWTSASRRQRERLLELIRRLAEDDKDGVMAHKVLTLFWNLAHSEEVPTEIMDQALTAHVKILDYSCSQERDAQKTVWLDKCVDELKTGEMWVLPALKQIKEICCLYEPSTNGIMPQRGHHMYYRQEVIEKLQTQHSLVILVTKSLTAYMSKLRVLVKTHADLTSENYMPDGRYCHVLQVQERLNFLRFLLKDGQLWLCAEQAKQIWQCLAENAVFASDRESCFKWFSKLMGEEPDLDPGINKDFFENNILQLEPTLLTESGIKCFERFFKAVNTKEGKLKAKRRCLLTEDPDLIGLEYLWKVVTLCPDDIAARAIELLREVSTNLGPRLMGSQLEFHHSYIAECYDRLRAYYDTVKILQSQSDKDFSAELKHARIRSEAVKICRVMHVLHEYISECDNGFVGERKILPLHRACRGKHLSLVVRFSSPNRQVDDFEVFTHSNDTLASLRKHILRRIKPGVHCKLELYINGEALETTDDKKLLSQIALRDKMLISAKVTQVNSNIASSQDSSSDSSTSSPQHPYDGPNMEAENFLPGVLLSLQSFYAIFFCQLTALGSSLEYPPLRDGGRALLQLMPCDTQVIQRLLQFFTNSDEAENSENQVETLFFNDSPAEVLYNLEVLYALLMPALETLSEKSLEVQYNFLVSGHAHIFLEMLTKNNFMSSADTVTKRSAYLVVLKICKLILTSVANVLVRLSEEENETNENLPTQGMYLKRALRSAVPGHADQMVKQVCIKLSQRLADLIFAESGRAPQALFSPALNWELPNAATVNALLRLVWAASSANLQSLNASPEMLHSLCDPTKRNAPLELHADDVLLCKEAFELLSISLVMNARSLEDLCHDDHFPFRLFLTDLLLLNPSRAVRIAAAEQFLAIFMFGSTSRTALKYVTPLLFSLLDNLVLENAVTSHEYFQLLCRLVNEVYVSECSLPNAEALLAAEVTWLRRARGQHEVLLEGHLSLARELLSFMSAEQKCELGCAADKSSLIRELVEDFLFPASKLMLQYQRTGQMGEDPATPVCDAPQTQAAAFDLLISLCVNCVPNCKQLVSMLTNMFYADQETAIGDWDYLPSVGPRPLQGFVGLKNAGATCYMNSVLQQLYMVHSIRAGILACEGAATDPNEDFSGEGIDGESSDCDDRDDNRKDYNVGILKQVQAIFGHLACSRLQFYVPKGLWRHFKLQGEPVNLREQQDAVEFFMALVESLDEALKTLGHEQIMSKILGGSYSDQKICKGCPHRYSKEEPFSVISVDIRNHSSLTDSLEQYVKGELLEGADAYHCEKCAKKVVTVKRLCVKKLPPVLAIQLKRFEYDFERLCAIKFNDYFEFPRDLDMEPYTVSGLARLEGEIIDCDIDPCAADVCTAYRLSGIVVHSGQASGGHYYSYIKSKEHSNGEVRWYKFDDGEVSECRMGEDEEMKVQCFGGDYMGEVFDPMLKRTTYRRQKRWWNAYMLFYTRLDIEEDSLVNKMRDLTLQANRDTVHLKMPVSIESSIRRQNIKFLHHRSQFSAEYFTFIRKFVHGNAPPGPRVTQPLPPEVEQQSMLSTQLASKFLFHTGWHTKKNLRGSAMDWCDVLCLHVRAAPSVRAWFAQHMLFNHPHRFCEYLLSCPSNEVRSAFMKIVVLLAHFAMNDGPCPCPPGLNNADASASLSDHILWALLSLLQREVSEHGRHLPHYCNVFHMYASQGTREKEQLLKMNVPATFMLVALDEGPGPAIKYQYTELGKLHQVVSCLVRCCDISAHCKSSSGDTALPNPFGDHTCPEYIMPLSAQASEILFSRTSYIKKVIEDSNLTDESVKLLEYCSWENPTFSRTVLSELLWQIAFAYCQELRHHIELLLAVLLLEDSWQTHRVHNAIKGIQEEREGLLETIARSKNHYQKRAYQCVKCMVALFSKCRPALHMLHKNADVRKQWGQAVAWLQDELERRYQTNPQYTYSTWSPPPQSNENSNGYFLERSNSARKTLERALELMPESERDEDDASEEQESQEEATETYQAEATTSSTASTSTAATTATNNTVASHASSTPAGSANVDGTALHQIVTSMPDVTQTTCDAHPNNANT